METEDTSRKREWFVDLSVNRARKMAEEGHIEKAYEILVGVTDHHQASTLHDLLSTWKDELLESLRSQFPDMQLYPQCVGDSAEIKRHNLRAKDVYVLKLFDGVTSLDDAIAISPVDEFETLRATSKLLKMGLLDLPETV